MYQGQTDGLQGWWLWKKWWIFHFVLNQEALWSMTLMTKHTMRAVQRHYLLHSLPHWAKISDDAFLWLTTLTFLCNLGLHHLLSEKMLLTLKERVHIYIYIYISFICSACAGPAQKHNSSELDIDSTPLYHNRMKGNSLSCSSRRQNEYWILITL